VDRSSVWQVEGKTPEGIEKGKHASYFNAEAGDKMIVVSWTGEEMEFYNGTNLSSLAVAGAFGLAGFSAFQFALTSGRRWSNAHVIGPFAVLAVIAVMVTAFIINSHSPGPSHPAPVKVTAAGPSPLSVGLSGALNGVTYRIASHNLAEIAEVGIRFQEHEYDLTDNQGNEALLIRGGAAADASWKLCALLPPQSELTPLQAGGLWRGEEIHLDQGNASVTELFRCTTSGNVFYGFTGRLGTNIVMARWDQIIITEWQVSILPNKTVRAAFGL
jgi:hypothetical protein